LQDRDPLRGLTQVANAWDRGPNYASLPDLTLLASVG
jgi:hypothetical protein